MAKARGICANGKKRCFAIPNKIKKTKEAYARYIRSAAAVVVAEPKTSLQLVKQCTARKACVLAVAGRELTKKEGKVLKAVAKAKRAVAFAKINTGKAKFSLLDRVPKSKGDGPLLIYDGPPLLYTLTGSRFPTPLAFPNHLHQASESDVSHIATLSEVERLLAQSPGAIVDRTTRVTNTATSTLVRAYAKRNCRKVASQPLLEGWDIEVVVYGHCRAAADQ